MIHSVKQYAFKHFKPYMADSGAKPDISIILEGRDFIVRPGGRLLADGIFKWVKRYSEDEDIVVYVYSSANDNIIYLLQSSPAWNHITIQYLNNGASGENAVIGPVGDTVMRNAVLLHQGLMIHASVVEFEEKGIMFSAPCGTGKSTQASLWKSFRKAVILNDDRPIVRLAEGIPFVFGTPWLGKISDCVNRSAPLKAIFVLEQSSDNSVKRLDVKDAIKGLLPRCFMPFYDRNLMNMAIDVLEKIIEAVPVYLMKCRPDEASVEMVYDLIK